MLKCVCIFLQQRIYAAHMAGSVLVIGVSSLSTPQRHGLKLRWGKLSIFELFIYGKNQIFGNRYVFFCTVLLSVWGSQPGISPQLRGESIYPNFDQRRHTHLPRNLDWRKWCHTSMEIFKTSFTTEKLSFKHKLCHIYSFCVISFKHKNYYFPDKVRL